MYFDKNIRYQKICVPDFPKATLYIKRIDEIHPEISGNKYYKLKYNIEAVKKGNHKGLLTFGGASSNHIAAVACMGQIKKTATVGIIRGEELATSSNLSPTLKYAKECGMALRFVSREIYKRYTQGGEVEKSWKDKGWYILPEGGTNTLAIRGCEEILSDKDLDFDIICCPAGTGGTLAGLCNSSANHKRIIGFSALKGDFLTERVKLWTDKAHWEIISEDVFGGYAKVSDELVAFINNFFERTKIPLDPIYTGKMLFRIFELYGKGYFCPSDKVLAIHTGGMQGIPAMNDLLKRKNKKTIHFYG